MNIKKIFALICAFLIFCSTQANAETEKECFEKVSRTIFKFNHGVDNLILEPIAKGYNKLPEPIRKGTGNFTSNIATLLSIPNHVLQGNFDAAGDAIGSFMINSTVGVLGLADVASVLGVNKTKEDLGQTFGRYGAGGGCYFVLPILGPTTVRDSVGMVGDMFLDPFATMTIRQKEVLNTVKPRAYYYSVKGGEVIDFRADNMKTFEDLEKNSLDLYSATKSFYLQKRERQISNSTISKDDDWEEIEKK